MAGLSGIVITEKKQQLLSFLSSCDSVSFGEVTEHIGDGSSVLNFILMGFFISLVFKNTMEITKLIPYAGKMTFKTNFKWALIFSILLFVSLLTLLFGHTSSSEFLYFNF